MPATKNLQVIENIVRANEDKAERLLDEFLLDVDVDINCVAKLAADLFKLERFVLLTRLFDFWTRIDPLNPEPWSNLGLSLTRTGDFSRAENALGIALSLDPKFAAAHSNLCMIYQQLGQHELQYQSAIKAVELQPDSPIALNNLGTALLELGRLEEAKSAFQESQRQNPNYFEPVFNLARVDSELGRHDYAIDFFESVLQTPNPNEYRYVDIVKFQLSHEYLWTGNIQKGWELYDAGFSPQISPIVARTPRRSFAVPMWDGRDLAASECLMIWREQGIGDELRFSALLPLVNPGLGKVIVECDPRLIPAFSRSLPNFIFREPTLYKSETLGSNLRDFDYHLPIGSLPRWLMKSTRDLQSCNSLLMANKKLKNDFKQRLAGFASKRKVGICWRGGKLTEWRNKKYTQINDWADLLRDPGSVFINLQYGECEDELNTIEKMTNVRILRWQDLDLRNDLESVLALISELDLIISVSTAVVPLAGAIGVPTLMLAHRNYFHLGESDIYPWFKSVIPVFPAASETVASCLPEAVEIMKKY